MGKSLVTGSITFMIRQVAAGVIASAATKLVECNLTFALRRFVHERIASHRCDAKLYHDWVPLEKSLGRVPATPYNHFLLEAYAQLSRTNSIKFAASHQAFADGPLETLHLVRCQCHGT